MNLIFKIIISSLSILLASYIIPGVKIDSYFIAILVSVCMIVLNYLVKPILIILTIPITIFTLGLFLLVINAVIILIADELIDGFHVETFLSALLFSLLVSLITSILESVNTNRNKERES